MPAFREETIRAEYVGYRNAEVGDRQAIATRGGRHGFPGSSDRVADGPHQRPDRPFQDARQGPPFAAGTAEARQPAPQDARLPQAKRQRKVSRAARATWPAQVISSAPIPRRCIFIETTRALARAP